MFRATLLRLRDDEMSGRVVVFARASEFDSEDGSVLVGQPMRFTARISHPSRHDLTVAVLNATGRPTFGRAGAVQQAAHTVRSRFVAAVRGVLPPDQAAMLPALVLGDTSAVAAETGREFRAAGMTHLTAVSGANVTIVCGAVLLSARLIGPRVAVLLAALALVAFVIVVQPTASVLRAAVMGAIALAGIVSSRRRQAIPALSATVLVLMATAPQLAVDVGFALSVLATAALIVIAPVWSRRLVGRGCPKPFADALAVAWAAHVVTVPLVAGISGRVSLVGAVANLAVAAVIAPITVLGSAAAVVCLLWPAGAQLLIRFTGPELWWVLRVAHWAAGMPGATVSVPAGVPGVLVVGATAVLMVALWRWRWFRAATGLAAVVALAWSLSGTSRPVVTPSWGERGFTVAPGPGRRGIAGRAGRGGGAAVGTAGGAGTDDVPVNRMRAGDVSTHELAELLSPSLFADERVVVLEAAADAGKEAAALVASAAADLPPGTVLVVVHTGGGRAKALANDLRSLGAAVHPCARLTKVSERVDFIRKEFRASGVKVDEETVTALLDAVGSDVRELASACSQLVADTGGEVDAAAVRRYHSGKAEVKGFDIADKAVTGDVAGAAEALRWAMMRGEPLVVLADALAEAVHTIGRVGRCPAIPTAWPRSWECRPGGCRRRRNRPGAGRVTRSPTRCEWWRRSTPTSKEPSRTPTMRWNPRSGRLPSWRPIGADERATYGGAQRPLRALASADFLLAAWFLWITPLLAALSSLRLVDASNSAAFSFSPAWAASRNARTAVRSEDFTDLLRSRARSLVRLRFCCDLMLATR